MASGHGSAAGRGSFRYGVPSSSGGPAATGRESLWASLEALYSEYCRVQAREFVRLVPREGIRPLYRQALSWAAEGLPEGADALEPMDLLETFCRREILPLPPFQVWVRNYLSNRRAYLEELDRGPAPARHGELVDVDLRELTWEGRRWTATLRIRCREESWRGSVLFRSDEGARAVTGEVFQEGAPHEVQERFRALEAGTLQAFLRSALPSTSPIHDT